MAENRDKVTITPGDVAKLKVTDAVKLSDVVSKPDPTGVTPVPPDERTDREKAIDQRLSVIESEITGMRTEQKNLVHERDELFTKRSAAKKVLAMSPAERKALGIPEPQVIDKAGGIESGEAIGDVGGSPQIK